MSETHAHIVPPRIYVAIFATLMVLTALTTWVAFIDLGPLNVVIMLVIAGVKASLVVLWFMHARYESTLTRVAIVGAVFWLLVLIVISASDIFIRARPDVVRRLGIGPRAVAFGAAAEPEGAAH
jgi:cytochrome c oxidase subunit 4